MSSPVHSAGLNGAPSSGADPLQVVDVMARFAWWRQAAWILTPLLAAGLVAALYVAKRGDVGLGLTFAGMFVLCAWMVFGRSRESRRRCEELGIRDPRAALRHVKETGYMPDSCPE